MGSITPVEKELIVGKGIEEVKLAIIKQLETMKGKIVKSDEAYIECDFGSLLKSRLLGELWVSKATLPKKAEIHIEGIGSNETKVRTVVRDTHKYGIKRGYVKKYEKALQEVVDSIVDAIRHMGTILHYDGTSDTYNYCTNCGNKIIKSSNYCNKCGTKTIGDSAD